MKFSAKAVKLLQTADKRKREIFIWQQKYKSS